MTEHILFLTGKLAEKQLRRLLEAMQPEFSYTVHQLGVKVAALMTTDMIIRRLQDTYGANRMIIPGRCRGEIDDLYQTFNIPVERGPEELKDLPAYFGKAAKKADLSQYAVNIFAEIVDAPNLSITEILQRARQYQQDGADVIDIGCLPSTPFPHLEETIQTLKNANFQVSIDSLNSDDLLRGGKAGADFLLSLKQDTLWIADEVDSTPVLIPSQHGQLDTLIPSIEAMQTKQRAFMIDPILDPIHFGFTESITRYYQARELYPDIEIMMGIGNLTELTHADTVGMNALLLGICSELNINHILTTEVSRHACKSVKEADLARRIMYAAQHIDALPKHIDDGMMALHETAPFPYALKEIKELAEQITDPSYRIQISPEGIHVYNRNGIHSAIDPFELFPHLDVEQDGGHAFYLGVELARAEIAWQLGKRYNQDQALGWGCASHKTQTKIDLHSFKPAGTTLEKKPGKK